MIESTVPLSRALATANWAVATLFTLASWISYGEGRPHLAIMLGMTGISFTAAGAVFTVSGWVGRICQVVRLTSTREPTPSVSPLR